MAKKKNDKIVRRRKGPAVRPRKKGNQRTMREWFFVFMLVVFCGAVGHMLFCSSFVSLVSIDVRGTDRVEQSSVQSVVESMLEGQKFTCIKNNNYFFVRTRKIEDAIKNDQRIKSVYVTKKFPHTIKIDITEYDVVPLWCLHDVGGECFELEDGCVVRRVDMQSSLVTDNRHFIVVDRGHDSAEDGQCLIPSEDIAKIQFLGEELIYTLNVGIVQPYIISFRGSREVRFDTDEGWHLLIDLSHDTQEILTTAQLFMKKVELPTKRIDLEYVDLRFPEKIFYKMKESTEVSEERGVEKEEASQ